MTIEYFQLQYEAKKLTLNDVDREAGIIYGGAPHERLYWWLVGLGHKVKNVHSKDLSTKLFNRKKDWFVGEFWEVVYCYGSGGQNLIVRVVPYSEVISNIKNNIFSEYPQSGDTWIEERNYLIIKNYDLWRNVSIHAKINKAVKMIKELK